MAEDFRQLKIDAVTAYLTIHNLPLTEYATVYSYGRSDLRTEIRSIMSTALIGIAKRAPYGSTGNYGNLNAHEIQLYKWLSSRVKSLERASYQRALEDKNSFLANPCTWHPDPEMASAFGLSYSAPGNCFEGGTPGGPSIGTVPSVSYFEGAAFKYIYGQQVSFPGGPAMIDMVAVQRAEIVFASIGALATLTGVTATLAAISLDLTSLALAGDVGAEAFVVAADALMISEGVFVAASTALSASGIGIAVTMLILGILGGHRAGEPSAAARRAHCHRPGQGVGQSNAWEPDLASLAVDGFGQMKLTAAFLPLHDVAVTQLYRSRRLRVFPGELQQSPTFRTQNTDPIFSVPRWPADRQRSKAPGRIRSRRDRNGP